MITLGMLALSLTYAAVFAIVTNNIADLAIDKISNPDRPLIKNEVNRKQYLIAAVACLAWSVLLAFCLDTQILFGVVLISLVYFVYSCKPFRFKRIPLFAKFMIGINSLIAACCGFILAGGRPVDFPMQWLGFILIPLSLAANFIDLKDTAGDKKDGIMTLPVLMGEPAAVLFICLATLATYAVAACLLNIHFVYALSCVLATVHCYFLVRKPYRERPVFLIYLASIWGLIIILFFQKQLIAFCL